MYVKATVVRKGRTASASASQAASNFLQDDLTLEMPACVGSLAQNLFRYGVRKTFFAHLIELV